MVFSATEGYPMKPKPGVMINPLHPLSLGLVGYWLLNEGAGSRVNDISGHGNHGVLKNMSPNAQNSGWGGSEFGGGLQFDGGDDYVDCGNDESLDITEAITVETWVNLNSKNNYAGIVDKPKPDNTEWTYRLSLDDSADQKIRFKLWDSGGSAIGDVFSNNAISTGEWLQVVGVYSGSVLQLFMNAVKQTDEDTGLPGTAINTNNYDLTIGAIVPGDLASAFLNASINSARIYNRALSGVEVKTLYHDPFCNLLQVPSRRWYVPPAVGNPFWYYNMLRRRS